MAQETKTVDLQECIENCQACHRACLEMETWCLEKGGEYANDDVVRMLHDCADICRVSADFMIRGSEQHAVTCRACADVCTTVAERFSEFSGDEETTQFVTTLKECARSCQAMAGS